MKKAAVLVCMVSVLLSGCSGAGGEKVSQTADSCAQAVASELAKTDWTAVSTDANSDDAAYVMAHTDMVALDRLIAFTLTADGGPSEGACEELRSRFLESPAYCSGVSGADGGSGGIVGRQHIGGRVHLRADCLGGCRMA